MVQSMTALKIVVPFMATVIGPVLLFTSRCSADQAGRPPQITIPDSVKRMALTKINVDIRDADNVQAIDSISSAIVRASGRPLDHPLNINALLRTFKVSLKVTDIPAEDVLRAVAALGHGSLYYSENGFLLADPRMIRPSEKDRLIPAPLPLDTSKASVH